MMGRWAVGLVLAVMAQVALEMNGVLDGTTPLWHLSEAHGFTELDLPRDLSNFTVLITGATSGLGLGLAKVLERRSARLVLTARSQDKCDALVLSKKNSHSCVVVELMDLSQLRGAAAQLEAAGPFDALVLNAGIMAPPTLEFSADGIEAQFATNHLGHFELLRLLLPSLRDGARVVAVSSIAHWFAPASPLLSLDALHDTRTYDPFSWYGFSKLCNILLVRELIRREPRLVAHAVHPGAVRSKLLRFLMPEALANLLQALFYWDAETAALTVARPLFDPSLASGAYLVPIARQRDSSKQASNSTLAADLWRFSEDLLANLTSA